MKSLARQLEAALPAVLSAVVSVLVLALVSASRVPAQEDNPFARPGPVTGGAPAAPSPLDTLELRGLFPDKGVTYVFLFNSAENKSVIVPLGSTVNGLTVTDYQQADDSVLVQSGGRERRVAIKKVVIATMVAPPPIAAPVPQPGGPAVAVAQPPPGQPGAAMGDEEVRRRMERVAEEIRRRREMRREIMERQGQGQPAGQPTQ